MSTYLTNFKNLRKELKYILYISIIIIFFIEFIGYSYDEIFPSAYTFSNIILKICYSYVASLIFYYLFVHYKRQDDKRKYYEVLSSKLNKLIKDHNSVFEKIACINGVNDDAMDDEESLKIFLKKIGLYQKYDGVFVANVGRIDWKTRLTIISKTSTRNIENIYLHSSILEVELIQLLEKVINNGLFQTLISFENIRLSNENFEDFYKDFYSYRLSIKNLRIYKEKEIDMYIL